MANEFFAAVGARVRELREERGLSLDELARAASLNKTYLWKAESGLHNMSLQTLGRLALGLGVQPSALLDGLTVGSDILAAKPRANARDPARRS